MYDGFGLSHSKSEPHVFQIPIPIGEYLLSQSRLLKMAPEHNSKCGPCNWTEMHEKLDTLESLKLLNQA